MSRPLADKLEVLRDEVLQTARWGDDKPPGAEVFDAVLRRAAGRDDGELDLTLREAISRRLAWGDSEADILASSSEVCARLLRACERALGERERLGVSEIAAEIGSAAARAVALTALSRTGKDRAELLREERTKRRLEEARERQRADLGELERAFARARGSGDTGG